MGKTPVPPPEERELDDSAMAGRRTAKKESPRQTRTNFLQEILAEETRWGNEREPRAD